MQAPDATCLYLAGRIASIADTVCPPDRAARRLNAPRRAA